MKTLKIIFSAIVLSFIAVSCIVDDEVDVNFGEGAYIVGFENPVAVESYFTDEGTITKNYPLNVLGGADGTPPKEDITVTYEIDPASTATEGVEFDFVTSGGTLTIPAGQSFVNFPLKVNTGNFNSTEKTELILKITSTNSDNAVVSAIDNTLAITFVGCLSTLDSFTYVVTTVRGDGALVTDQVTETLTLIDVNTFQTESVGAFGPSSAGGPIAPPANYNGFIFSDICGEITVNSQNLGGYYSNLVFGNGTATTPDGTVDPVTGDITISYTITFAAGNRTFVSTYVKQ